MNVPMVSTALPDPKVTSGTVTVDRTLKLKVAVAVPVLFEAVMV